jgi:LacI family transcriptional regulator
VYDALSARRSDSRRELNHLGAWVKSLPRPVGIMACYDIRARLLLDACRQLELAVPEQVAVIGVDNDEVICDLCEPRLSSVVPDTYRTGYMAAQLLDALMSRQSVKVRTHRIPPLGVRTRASSDVLVTRNPLVIASLRYIREHACDGINIQDVARHFNVSRKTLDRHFLDTFGRTPHSEVVRVRVDRAKRLLTETQLPLRTIADRTGFAHVEYFSVAFKRQTGTSPAAYRRIGGDQITSLTDAGDLESDARESHVFGKG